jgi:hypothetical protein
VNNAELQRSINKTLADNAVILDGRPEVRFLNEDGDEYSIENAEYDPESEVLYLKGEFWEDAP